LSRTIRIGTRGSELALWQARYTQAQLAGLGVDSELHIIKTQGDRIQHLSFDKMEGKGFFTKEIEEALLREEVDLAVHSLKDLPTQHPEGLVLAGLSERADPADWLVRRKERLVEGALFGLPEGAVVGTSSARRKAQMLAFRPDIRIRDIRGNVPTRLGKLRDGQFDAILLAAAGVTRIQADLSDLDVLRFHPKEFVPAPGQGVLGWQVRTQDLDLRRQIQQIHHVDTSDRTNIERSVLRLFGGGCHMPLGVYCEHDAQGYYHVWAAMADAWDAPLRRTRQSSSTQYELAEQVVEALKQPV